MNSSSTYPIIASTADPINASATEPTVLNTDPVNSSTSDPTVSTTDPVNSTTSDPVNSSITDPNVLTTDLVNSSTDPNVSTTDPIIASTTYPVTASTTDKTRRPRHHRTTDKVTVSMFDPNNVAPTEHKRPEIVLLTVGRSGNGKTSLTNSIVGFSQCACAGRDKAVNLGVNLNVVIANDVNGVDVAVCDGISVDEESPTDTKDLIKNIETFFRCCNKDFKALLIVLKYGVRFTKQEKDTILLIKYLLGEDCIRNYGIIVFTYGDNFDLDYEGDDTHTNFSCWCQQERGDIQGLFREVNFRYVLYNNRDRDIRKSDIKQNILIEKITSLQSKEPYTIEMYYEHLLKTIQQEFENLNKLVGDVNFKSSCDELVKKLMSADVFFKQTLVNGNTWNLPVDEMHNKILELKISHLTVILRLQKTKPQLK